MSSLRAGTAVGIASQRIVVTTWYDEAFTPLGDLCRDSLTHWCREHGYEHAAVDIPRSIRPLAWHKIEIIRHLLDGGADFVMWIDADAIVVRPDVGIRERIEDGKDLYLVNHRYGGKNVPNAGVLLLRNSDWTRRLLDDIWNREEFIDHPWWENAALIELLGYFEAFGDGRESVPDTTRMEKVRWLDRKWNSLPELDEAEDAVITHYAGRPMAYRMEHMQREAEILARSRNPLRRAVRWARRLVGTAAVPRGAGS